MDAKAPAAVTTFQRGFGALGHIWRTAVARAAVDFLRPAAASAAPLSAI